MGPGSVNASYLTADRRRWAASGINHVQDVFLLPNMEIWRFASTDQPEKWLANPWWIGLSPYQALLQLSRSGNASLTDTARACLAVVSNPAALERPNRMDVLSHARITKPLTAWSGTPRTQRLRLLGRNQYIDRQEPDRRITQLFIPGLEILWKDVLTSAGQRLI
jgi:hypothetical protein